jgi:hypothetical protein
MYRREDCGHDSDDAFPAFVHQTITCFRFLFVYQINSPAFILIRVKYCPNGECVNFQIEIETNVRSCPMCDWLFVPVAADKKSAESTNGKPGQSEVA